jgi:hypothetical protein
MAFYDPFSFTSDQQLMHVWDDDVFNWDYFNLFDNIEMQLDDGSVSGESGSLDGEQNREVESSLSGETLTVGTCREEPNLNVGVPCQPQMYMVPQQGMTGGYGFDGGRRPQVYGYPSTIQNQDYEWEHPLPLEKNEPCFLNSQNFVPSINCTSGNNRLTEDDGNRQLDAALTASPQDYEIHKYFAVNQVEQFGGPQAINTPSGVTPIKSEYYVKSESAKIIFTCSEQQQTTQANVPPKREKRRLEEDYCLDDDMPLETDFTFESSGIDDDDPTGGFKLPASKSPIMEAMVVCALNGWGLDIVKNNRPTSVSPAEVVFRVTDFNRYYKISRAICSKQRPTDDLGSRIKSLRRWFVNFPKKKDRCDNNPFHLIVKPAIAKKVNEIIERNSRTLGLTKRRRRL